MRSIYISQLLFSTIIENKPSPGAESSNRVFDRRMQLPILQESLRTKLLRICVFYLIMKYGPEVKPSESVQHPKVMSVSVAYHVFCITTDPAGIKQLSYLSSARLLCGIPRGRAGCHLKHSLQIASMYGRLSLSENSGSRSGPTTLMS